MVADVAANIVWKNMNVQSQSAAPWSELISHPSVPMTPQAVLPNMNAAPVRKNAMDPRPKSNMFFIMMLAAFFARVMPVSTIAKPACMAKTRMPPIIVHTMFRLIWTCAADAPFSSAASMPTALNIIKINILIGIFIFIISYPIASPPRSPVLMRMQSSIGRTNILPSPM